MNLIETRIKTGLSKRTGKEMVDIQNEMRLIEDLGLGSLDIFELSFELETEFEIEIPTVDALRFVRVQDVITYIKGRTHKD